MYLSATYTYHYPPAWAPYQSVLKPTAVPLAWIVFTAAWVGQFIGHGVFEHRAPALKDNLVQGRSRLHVHDEAPRAPVTDHSTCYCTVLCALGTDVRGVWL